MRGFPAGAGAYRAYSVSSPIRRWNTSDLFATVGHYRVAKVCLGLALAVRANPRQGCGNSPRIERFADRLWLVGRGHGGRRGSRILVHVRCTQREASERLLPARRRQGSFIVVARGGTRKRALEGLRR